MVLPVLKQTLLEARAADRGLHQLRIDGAQRVEIAFTGEKGMGYPPERKEPQVRNAGLLNQVKAAVIKDFKDKAQVEFSTPAEAFSKRQRQGITVVDLGEQVNPPERKEPQVRNAGLLNQVKAAVIKENYLDTLRATLA
jgi:hypothetical protein